MPSLSLSLPRSARAQALIPGDAIERATATRSLPAIWRLAGGTSGRLEKEVIR